MAPSADIGAVVHTVNVADEKISGDETAPPASVRWSTGDDAPLDTRE
jgi:hypothetical protein